MFLVSEGTYARQLLQEKGIEMWAGDRRILEPLEKPVFKIPRIRVDTQYTFNPTIKPKSIITVNNYQELQEYGFMTVARTPKIRRRGQRIEYAVVPQNPNVSEYGLIPPDHKILYDTERGIAKMIGPNSDPRQHWVSRKRKPEAPTQNILQTIMEKSGLTFKEQKELIKVPDIAVLYDRCRLCCIPLEPDEPLIGLFGARGTGKSFLMNRIMGQAYWKWGVRPAILNDLQAETEYWSRPWHKPGSEQMILTLAQINEFPLPTPMVYLHPPKSRELLGEKAKVGYRISLSFREMMTNYRDWMKISETLELKKALSRFMNIIPSLVGKGIMEQISIVKDKEIGVKIPELQEKFEETLKFIDGLHIMDCSTGVYSLPVWTVKEIETREELKLSAEILPPWIACLRTGLIPVIVTKDIETDNIVLPLLEKKIGDDIIDWQDSTYSKDDKVAVWIFYDEMERIASKNNQTIASDTLKKLATAGRPKRIGLVYATQDYSETLDQIIQNTTHAFCFSQKDKEARRIKKDYALTDKDERKMKQLGTFEAMAVTKKSFRIYDTFNGEILEAKTFTGVCLPPVESHKKPRDV